MMDSWCLLQGVRVKNKIFIMRKSYVVVNGFQVLQYFVSTFTIFTPFPTSTHVKHQIITFPVTVFCFCC